MNTGIALLMAGSKVTIPPPPPPTTTDITKVQPSTPDPSTVSNGIIDGSFFASVMSKQPQRQPPQPQQQQQVPRVIVIPKPPIVDPNAIIPTNLITPPDFVPPISKPPPPPRMTIVKKPLQPIVSLTPHLRVGHQVLPMSQPQRRRGPYDDDDIDEEEEAKKLEEELNHRAAGFVEQFADESDDGQYPSSTRSRPMEEEDEDVSDDPEEDGFILDDDDEDVEDDSDADDGVKKKSTQPKTREQVCKDAISLLVAAGLRRVDAERAVTLLQVKDLLSDGKLHVDHNVGSEKGVHKKRSHKKHRHGHKDKKHKHRNKSHHKGHHQHHRHHHKHGPKASPSIALPSPSSPSLSSLPIDQPIVATTSHDGDGGDPASVMSSFITNDVVRDMVKMQIIYLWCAKSKTGIPELTSMIPALAILRTKMQAITDAHTHTVTALRDKLARKPPPPPRSETEDVLVSDQTSSYLFDHTRDGWGDTVLTDTTSKSILSRLFDIATNCYCIRYGTIGFDNQAIHPTLITSVPRQPAEDKDPDPIVIGTALDLQDTSCIEVSDIENTRPQCYLLHRSLAWFALTAFRVFRADVLISIIVRDSMLPKIDCPTDKLIESCDAACARVKDQIADVASKWKLEYDAFTNTIDQLFVASK